MLLTRIWAAVLSLLATAFLAGMFLLSVGSSGGFTDSDRTAIRAVTEAGLAAFEADIQSSPVGLGPSLLTDSRLKAALELEPDAEPPEGLDLQGTLALVANEGLLDDYPLMSVALVDRTSSVVAKTGLDEGMFDQLLALAAFTTVQASNDEGLFSATLGGKLFAVKVSRPDASSSARRLVALHAVDLGGGSFLRRVLGTSNPAGLVRDGEPLGEVIGGANPSELVALVTQHLESAPPQGASQVFEIGEGSGKRLGALGRVPGPAGKGSNGTIFAVLSLNTEGATQKDLAEALSEAMNTSTDKVSWPLILGLLLVSLVLSFYLPHLEASAPLRRLAGEFRGLAQGTQAQIFHDTYGGPVAQVARAAAQAQEALRLQWEAELNADLASDGEDDPPPSTTTRRTARATRSNRRAGRTRRGDAVREQTPVSDPTAIDLPEASPGTPDLRAETSPAAGSTSSGAAERPAPAAPTLNDELDELEAASLLGDSLSEPEPPARAPEPPARAPAPPPAARAPGAPPAARAPGAPPRTPAGAMPPPAAATAPPAPTAPTDDPREAYYREVFDEFVEIKTACGESLVGFTFDKFVKKLRKNTEDLMGRPGVRDVRFSVYVKDGKAALKAKVVKD